MENANVKKIFQNALKDLVPAHSDKADVYTDLIGSLRTAADFERIADLILADNWFLSEERN